MFPKFSVSPLRSFILLTATLFAALPISYAQLTDIANQPVAGAATINVKPNIMLLMDASGSMSFSHMPDEVEGLQIALPIGYKSYQCNSLYYNPNTVYSLPKDYLGNALPVPSFNAARHSYYSSSDTAVVDLSSAFQAYDTTTRQNQATTGSDQLQAAYYYIYTGTISPISYKTDPCTQVDTGTSGFSGNIPATGGNWKRTIVSATSGISTALDERQNFAIWYTYYRTRMAMTKSSLSRAFATLTDSFRVGFISVNPGTPVSADKYLAINDFTPAAKSAWYNKIFSQDPAGSSPMREGLARVGRHYGGKQDGINQGMTGDPVQYSCQKNFTLMTTDGYWNAAAETAGPVQLDGVTLVGKQDGVLTVNTNWTPRPIWDGGSTSTLTTTDKSNAYTPLACVGNYTMKATKQTSQISSQTMQSTTQNLKATQQNLQSTQNTYASTTQTLSTTTQTNKVTAQTTQSTSQLSKSTLQNLQSTSQYQQYTTTLTQTQTSVSIATSQNLISTSQVKQATAQVTQTQTQQVQTTNQISQTVTQALASTSQVTQSTSRTTSSTLQNLAATSRVNQTVTQVSQSTSQINSYNGLTELQTPVLTCTPGGNISCPVVTTGPTLVASCTPATATAANNYTVTTCTTTTVSGPTAVASCTPVPASSGNSFQTTSCATVTTAATPVASCTNTSPSSGNSYTTTTCSSVSTGPTPVASCSTIAASSGNNYVATTCTPVSTGPTVVASCSASGPTSANSYTTTTCGTNPTGPTGVSSCTAASPTSANSYTTTTCTNGNSGPTPVASCTPQTAGSGNSWIGKTCNTATVGPTAVATCTAQTASSSNSYTATTCNPVTVTATQGVSSCTPVTATSANGFVATVCGTNNTAATFVSACTAAVASSGNSWTTTTCTPVLTGPTGASTCAPVTATSGNSWKTTTCSVATTGPTLAASCTASAASSGNSYVTTTCPVTTVSAATAVTSCTAQAASSANSYVTTTCTNPASAISYLSSCTPGSVTVGAVTTICTNVTTGPTPVATCTPQTAASGNQWLTRTCPTPISTGPTLVATCTTAAASSSNSYTATTCANATTGPTPVASCTTASPVSGNNFVTTTCTPVNTGPTPIAAASCVAASPSSLNSYITTTCPVTTVPTGVSTCAPVAAASGNNYTATTCSANNTGPTLVATCAPQTAASSNSWIGQTCTTTPVSSPTPVATCTPVAASSSNGFLQTVCTQSNTAPTPIASCTNTAPSSGNSFTTTTCSTAATGPTAVPSCAAGTGGSPSFLTTTCSTVPITTLVASCSLAAPSSANNYTTIACSDDATGPTQVTASSCTAADAAAGNNYIQTTCTPLAAHKIQVATTTSVVTQNISNVTVVSTSPTTTSTTSPVDFDGVCYTDGVDTLPVQPPKPPPPSGCSAWPCAVTANIAIGGSANSLADVAQYYYVTDLRPSMVNDVKAIGTGLEDDTAPHQHMTTFGLGLGVAGTLAYQTDYKSASTGAFAQIRTGAQNWPAWPDLTVDYSDPLNYNNPKSIDDFWHAAVNGRGQYFSAGNPDSVVEGLNAALSQINTVAGAGGGAAVSTGMPIVSDNLSFLTSFATNEWTGDLQARAIDISSGQISATVNWSARDKLDAMTSAACDNRVIYIRRPAATSGLANFTWNTSMCDATGAPTGSASTELNTTEQAYFGSNAVMGLSQYAAMTDGSTGTANQRLLAAGANFVNFVRGQRGFEGFIANNASKLYRQRAHVLSDIVGSVPAVVKAPSAGYTDAGYSAFKTANMARTPMIYVGSNGGMLHAFYDPILATDSQIANAGKEAWSYIPQALLPNLYHLSDNGYSSRHLYFVDGTPSTGDVYDSVAASWKTILVGGLNAGGKGYYALDVTNPTSPKSLWEFNLSSVCYDPLTPSTNGADCNIGLTFGRPIITKLVNGTWVVLVTSGYNNVSSTAGSGDGQGYLYVLNAITGSIISKISTGVGSSTNPSGLREINNYVSNGSVDNTTLRVYGGDLFGNIWRFDINDNINPAGKEATLVATAKDSGGTAQPITTRIQLAEVDGQTMIVAATGKFLGSTDTSTTQQQSVYGFKDTPGASVLYSDLRGSLLHIGLTQSGTTRTAACTGGATNCALSTGWVVDLPETSERVNVDPFIVLGTVVFDSNVPSNSACEAGGHSWINYVNLLTGGTVSTSSTGIASEYLNNSLSVGIGFIMLPDGRVIGTSVGADTSVTNTQIPVQPLSPMGRRVSWREIKR